MKPSPTNITQLLTDSRSGKEEANAELFEVMYHDLRRLAASYFRNERPNHTLQPTALVNEACLRLLKGEERNWENKAQFFTIAANVMRHILVDHARTHLSKKRGGGQKKLQLDETLQPSGQSLDHALVVSPEKYEELLAIHGALERLAELDPRQARMVELRYFGGMTDPEISKILGVTERTVCRDWNTAKLWLQRELVKG
jgi:RNA polymerase sigma factor (TIGR02999 family)